MKKTILALAAVATMVACSKDEIVNEAPKVPIAFGNAFVENTTRAIDNSYQGSNYVQSFNVYGTVTGKGENMGTANIFDGDVVTRPNGLTGYDNTKVWSCNDVQYWIPNSDYAFTAIVDGDVKEGTTVLNSVAVDGNGMPTSITYNATTQKDILLATQSVSIKDVENSDGGFVTFTFDHLLSKVKFQVKNTMDNQKTSGVYSYKVSDIKINDAAMTATYYITEQTVDDKTVTAGTWGIIKYTENDDFFSFGNATTNNSENAVATAIFEGGNAYSNYERLLVPADYSSNNLSVTFTVQTLVSDILIREKTYTKNVAVNLEKGNAYNFVIELDAPGEEIKFTVEEVNEWDTDHNNDGKNPDNTLCHN